MRTSTQPRGSVFTSEPTGPVTRLRVVGRAIEFDLRGLPARATIGRRPGPGESGRADLQIDHPLVSLIHGELERRGERLWYSDSSKNGTYVRSERETQFVVTRGMRFRLAEPTLIALDELLATLRIHLAWSIGLDDHAGIDDALARVVDDQPVLLIGPPGCDQERLARAIHDSSGRRIYPYLSLSGRLGKDAEPRLDEARWGTVFVDLHDVRKVTAGFARKLFGAALFLRPVIASPDLEHCHAVLGQLARASAIRLPPLDERRQDVPRLIDHLLAATGVRQRVADLGHTRAERLLERSWPQNLAQLREAAARIGAMFTHPHLGAAAASLEPPVSRQALDRYLRRLFEET